MSRFAAAVTALAGLALVAYVLAGGGRGSPIASSASGTPAIGRIRSIEGSVQIRRSRSVRWEPAAPEMALEPGDQIQTLGEASALLWIDPDRTIQMFRDSLVTLQQASRLTLDRGAAEVAADDFEVNTGTNRITTGRRRILFMPPAGDLPDDPRRRRIAEIGYLKRWIEETRMPAEQRDRLIGMVAAVGPDDAGRPLDAIGRELSPLLDHGREGVITVARDADGNEHVLMHSGRASVSSTLGSLDLAEGTGVRLGRGRAPDEPRRLLAAPRAASPIAGEIVYNAPQPLLTWDPVEGAASYRVEVAADAAFSRRLEDRAVAEPRYAPDRKLADGVYYWRVRAVEGPQGGGELSSAHRFELRTDRVPPSLEILSRPRWRKGS